MVELRDFSQIVAAIGKEVRGWSTVRGLMELLMQTWHGFSKR